MRRKGQTSQKDENVAGASERPLARLLAPAVPDPRPLSSPWLSVDSRLGVCPHWGADGTRAREPEDCDKSPNEVAFVTVCSFLP